MRRTIAVIAAAAALALAALGAAAAGAGPASAAPAVYYRGISAPDVHHYG